MSWSKFTIVLLLGTVGWMYAGCDLPPSPPRTDEGKIVKTLAPAEAAEVELLTRLQNARATYADRLQRLGEYYQQVGAYTKGKWVTAEQEGLVEAQTFAIEGITGEAAPATAGEQPTEAVLAEGVIDARQGYLDAIEALVNHYSETQEDFRARLLDNVRERLDPVHQYMYVEAAALPPADMRPELVYAEADALYADALKLYKRGSVVPLWPNYKLQRQALTKFLELVRTYPDSTKIAYSAFYIGQIYKNYFQQYHRAVMWYERAWQWDPTIPRPARYQAAVITDWRLSDRAKAVELYRQVLVHEAELSDTNSEIARKRIAELSDK